MAYDLGGTSHFTASGNALPLDVGTIAAWIRPSFAPASMPNLYLWDTTGGARYYLKGESVGNILQVGNDGLGRDFDVTGLWSANAWVHIALSYNKTGSLQKLYVNGAAVSVPSSGGSWGSTAIGTTLALGGRADTGAQEFTAEVAEWATWTVELGVDEIAALGKGFSPDQIRPGSLHAYWKLFGNLSPEQDYGKNKYDATLVDSPTKSAHPRIYYHSHAKVSLPAPGFAQFEAAVVGAGDTSASLTAGAVFTAAVTGAGATSASLTVGAGFTAAVTGAGSTSAAFAEIVPVGDVTVRIGIALWRTRVGSLQIRDLLNAAPNTCRFNVEGTAPTVGQAVEIRVGNGTITTVLLFAGSITNVAETYEGRPENLVWMVTCQDHTRTINRRKVRRRYAQQSATPIALDLMADYTTGFTTAGIVAGLPTVTGGIDFTEEDVLTCLTRLASRIGGYSDVDYEKDVRLFLTEASDAPDPLEAGYPFLHEPTITPDTDLSQLRTRVFVEGGGSQARNAVAVGATSIPVTDASWYSGSGGIVVSGPQRITYTGKGEVGGPSAPTGAQSLVVGNLGSGPYTYKVSQIDSGVESPLSAASAAVSIDVVPAPASALTAGNGSFSPPGSAPTIGTRTVGSGPDDGNHEYAVTFVTATGETTAGTRSSAVTTGPVSPSGTEPSAAVVADTVGNLSVGGYQYKETFVNAAGETTPSSAGSGSIAHVTQPSGMGVGTKTTGGSLTTGSLYDYAISYTTAIGETLAAGSAPQNLSSGETAVDFTGLPVSSDGRVTGKKLYRVNSSVDGIWRLVATLSAAATTHLDTLADASATPSMPVSNTSGSGRMTVTIHASGDPTVTARKIYRTVADGSTFKLLATINNNTATSYDDNTADGSLGADAPTSNTAARNVVPLTAIPTGPGGTTARKVYRTTAASPTGTLKLLTTLNNNTTTTYTDSTSDASLGAAAPSTNTAGGSLGTGTYGWKVTYITADGETTGNTAGTASITTGSAALTSVPTSADARVTSRKIYRTTVGGSTYLYEGTIANNTTTTFDSTLADGSLGSAIPTSNTTATGKISLTGIATGGGGVSARKLYRTVSGGATYKLVATISDNVTATLLDNVADGSLGVVAPGDIITALTGIPASGSGSVLYEIPISSDVNILEQCDDVAAQTALAAMEGGDSDGIYEHFIQDRRLASAEARATGNADLALFAYPIVTLRYATRDPKTRSGKTIHVDVPELNILGDFTIQSVVIDQIGTAQNTWPRYTVEASIVRFSFDDAIRRFQLAA